MYSTAYNLLTFTWFVHFELPFRLKGTEKNHTERFSKFPSNIYSILYGWDPLCAVGCKFLRIAWRMCKHKMTLCRTGNTCNRNLTILDYFLYTLVLFNNNKLTENYRWPFKKIVFINLVSMFYNLKGSELAT